MSEFLRNIAPWIWLYIAIGLFVAWMLITLWRDNRKAKRELDASLAQYFGKPMHEIPDDVLNLRFDDSMIRLEQKQAPFASTIEAMEQQQERNAARKVMTEYRRASDSGATKKGTK